VGGDPDAALAESMAITCTKGAIHTALAPTAAARSVVLRLTSGRLTFASSTPNSSLQ
jgi:hypothetical protein